MNPHLRVTMVQADLAWQDFRKAYPQFPVAEDDLARKK